MNGDVITNRLDLLISLYDSTTSLPVQERSITFIFRGEKLHPASRGSGNYLLINQGREDGPMQILAYGYEPYEAMVEYESLDEGLPTLDAFLIPSEKRPGQRYLSLSGQMDGISSIVAIKLDKPLTSYQKVDRRRRAMTVYMPNRRLNLADKYYGLVNVSEGMFEPIEVLRELDERRVLLRDPLQNDFPVNSPVYPVLFGQTDKEGNYLFRIRNEGEKMRYLIRYVVDGEPKFLTMDFGDIEGSEVSLEGVKR